VSHDGISMSGRKKSHREIQAETGTAGKKSKRKNEGRIAKIGPAAAAKLRTQSLPLPAHTSCTVLRAPVLCRLMTAGGYDFKKKQHSDLAGNRPQRQDIPVRRGYWGARSRNKNRDNGATTRDTNKGKSEILRNHPQKAFSIKIQQNYN
jgi:hypothetical protein